jgi:hypothetical protein
MFIFVMKISVTNRYAVLPAKMAGQGGDRAAGSQRRWQLFDNLAVRIGKSMTAYHRACLLAAV